MSESLFSHPMAFAVVALLPLFGIAAKVFGASFRNIAKWYLYISVFCVVVVMNSIFFPFIGGKDWFFRFAVELALVAGLLWWGFEARAGEAEQHLKALFKQPLIIATTVFGVMVVLASIFAFNTHAAFWSNFERGEGGFQMLHYLFFFLLLTFFFRDEKDWKKLFRATLFAAVFMIAYGLLAISGTPGFIGPYANGGAPTGWFAQLFQGRFQGSLGNPAYVAPYLIFAMFFAAYLWISSDREKREGAGSLRAWGFGGLIVIFFLFFWLSQTRGAFLGLGAGIVVLLIYLLFSKHRTLKKWAGIVLFLLVVLGGIGFTLRNNPKVQSLPGGRLLQISLSDATAQTRLWVWGEAWKGFLERPILGWGPENFTPVFDKYFDPRFYVPGENTETWFDRAHSVFFDYLVETGILGLLSYLSIFVAFYWAFFKSRLKMKTDSISTTLLNGFIFAVPIAYLVQGVAIFDVLPMYICLFTFLAFSSYYLSSSSSPAKS